MNTARNIDRSLVFNAHPSIDALEDRIQTSVTVSPMGGGFVVEAKGFAKAGAGTTIPRACANFIFNNRLAHD